MIALEKRPEPSRNWALITPLVAVVATMVCGGLLFGALGTNPLIAIRTIFWDPVFGEFAFYYRPQLLVKGAPLVLIAIGLSLGFKAGSGTSVPKGNTSLARWWVRGSGWRFIHWRPGTSFR